MLVGAHMREKVPELERIRSLQEPVLLLKARGLLQAGFKLHARQSYVPGTLTALLQRTIEALASGSKQHVKNFFKKI